MDSYNTYYKISFYVYIEDIQPSNYTKVTQSKDTPPQVVCYLTNGLKNKCGADIEKAATFQYGINKQLIGTISTNWVGIDKKIWRKVTLEGVSDLDYSQIQLSVTYPTYYGWGDAHIYIDRLTIESQCFSSNQDIILSSMNSQFGIPPKIYQASGSVLTSGYTEIDSYSFTSFIAAKEVLLSPGFKAEIGTGGLFVANVSPILPCMPYNNLKCGATPPGNLVINKAPLNDGSTTITARENQKTEEVNSKIKITNIDYALMTFQVESAEKENVRCIFYDMTGKQIKEYNFLTETKTNTYQIPINDLAGQIVVCNITSSKNALVKKIMIPE